MTILLLNYEYPPLGGGAANATERLLSEYSQRDDLFVTFVTSSTAKYRMERPFGNIEIHFLDIGKRGSLHYQSNAELLRYSWRAFWYARRLCRQRRFDVVHAFFGIPCGVLARWLGLPFVVSLRGSDVPGYSRRYRVADALLFRRLSRSVWRRACAVVANSAGLRDLALQSAPEQSIQVTPNGVDTGEFSPGAEPSAAAGLRILFVGRLIPRKGVADLLAALRGVTDVALTVVGDGPERDALALYAANHGIDATFSGNVEHSALPHLYRAHQLFVLPSYNEGMSNTVLEAMASGLPVVVTDVGGSGELVDENGVVVPVGDVEALRDAIVSFRDDPAGRSAMGVRSREIALRYSWAAVAQEYVAVYRRCGSDA